MQVAKPRATLRSSRALAFHGGTRGEATGTEMRMDVKQDIELGLAVPSIPGGPLQV
ncbi:MAG: hypothetical protein KGN32_05605 [Burkholderiales bacterium]|nr:hypothetical protein [Burkholderiales bacterium]